MVRALLAVLLIGCAAKPAVGERCPRAAVMASSPFCPAPPCVAGEVRDLLKNSCVRVVTTTTDREVLDAGTWTRLVIGTDGGEGSAYLCSALAHDSAVFGVREHGSLALRFTVDLVFPNNELARARVSVTAADPITTGALAPSVASRTADRAVDELVQSLRTSEGTSNAASVNATVRCVVRGDRKIM